MNWCFFFFKQFISNISMSYQKSSAIFFCFSKNRGFPTFPQWIHGLNCLLKSAAVFFEAPLGWTVDVHGCCLGDPTWMVRSLGRLGDSGDAMADGEDRLEKTWAERSIKGFCRVPFNQSDLYPWQCFLGKVKYFMCPQFSHRNLDQIPWTPAIWGPDQPSRLTAVH